jgi:hypothetical protein
VMLADIVCAAALTSCPMDILLEGVPMARRRIRGAFTKGIHTV